MTITIVHTPTKDSVDLQLIEAFKYRGSSYKRNLALGGNGVVYFWWNEKFKGLLRNGNRSIAFQIHKLYLRYLQEDVELYCNCEFGDMCPMRVIKEAIESWELYQEHPAYATYPIINKGVKSD